MIDAAVRRFVREAFATAPSSSWLTVDRSGHAAAHRRRGGGRRTPDATGIARSPAGESSGRTSTSVSQRSANVDSAAGPPPTCPFGGSTWTAPGASMPTTRGCARTIEAAIAFVNAVNPRPNAIVHSGGGIHAYWFLDRFIRPAEATPLLARWHESWDGRAAVRSLQLDETADLARLLRLPGTFNHKTSPRTPVELVP